MYHLPSNWTAQRSAEQESEMGYLARIRKGEARDAMDSTITTIEKTQGPRHHSDPLEAPRQAGGEKAPCVHNEPVQCPGRQPRHSSHPGASSPAERGDFDASIHTLGAMVSKLGVGPLKMLATRQAFLRRARIPSSVRDPRVRNAAIGPWIEIPFVNLNRITVNLALSVYSSQRTVH
ncbi:hypothetical protein V8E54_004393, partial [Elaphomyces granulatus]